MHGPLLVSVRFVHGMHEDWTPRCTHGAEATAGAPASRVPARPTGRRTTLAPDRLPREHGASTARVASLVRAPRPGGVTEAAAWAPGTAGARPPPAGCKSRRRAAEQRQSPPVALAVSSAADHRAPALSPARHGCRIALPSPFAFPLHPPCIPLVSPLHSPCIPLASSPVHPPPTPLASPLHSPCSGRPAQKGKEAAVALTPVASWICRASAAVNVRRAAGGRSSCRISVAMTIAEAVDPQGAHAPASLQRPCLVSCPRNL